MILIEVNNANTTNNFELIAKTQNWAEANIRSAYTIVLNPHINGDMRITEYDPSESSKAPLGTNTTNSYTDSDNTI